MQHGEFGETRGVAATGQGHHRVRRWIASDEIEGVLADRAGGAEHRVAAALRPWRREPDGFGLRSEEHSSELQPLIRISYAVLCLNNKLNNAAYPIYRTP